MCFHSGGRRFPHFGVGLLAQYLTVSDGSCGSHFLGLGHLIISGAEFSLLPLGSALAVCQCAHSTPTPSMSLQRPALSSTTHLSPLLPSPTFCSAIVLQDSFSSLSCQEMVGARLTSPRGAVLLFNTRIWISPLSCVLICKFQGVSSVCVVF